MPQSEIIQLKIDVPDFLTDKVNQIMSEPMNFRMGVLESYTLTKSLKQLYPKEFQQKNVIRLSMNDQKLHQSNLCLPLVVDQIYTILIFIKTDALLPFMGDQGYHKFVEFLSKTMSEYLEVLATQKPSSKYLNDADSNVGRIATTFINILKQIREKEPEIAVNLAKMCATFLKATRDVLIKKNNKDATRLANKFAINLGEMYLLLGMFTLKHSKNNPINALRYLIKSDELFIPIHEVQGVDYFNQKYCTNGFLCAVQLQLNNLEEAERFATIMQNYYKKLMKHSTAVEVLEITQPYFITWLTVHPFQLLADAYQSNNNIEKAVYWYQQLVTIDPANADSYKNKIADLKETLKKLIKEKQMVITQIATHYLNIVVSFSKKGEMINIAYLNEKTSYPLALSIDELNEIFNQLNNRKQEENQPTAVIEVKEPEMAPKDAVKFFENETTRAIQALAQKDSLYSFFQNNNNANATNASVKPINPGKEEVKETAEIVVVAEEKEIKKVTTTNDIDPHEIFGSEFDHQEIYPLRSPYIGKPVYFALFNPPSDVGLTTEELAQHRKCLEEGRIGHGIRWTPSGFKTWVSSHRSSRSGDIRFAAVGDEKTVIRKDPITKKDITYHLVNFNKLYDHSDQDVLYRITKPKSK